MKVIDLMQMYVNKEVLPKKIIIHDHQLFNEDTIWKHTDYTFYCREYNGDIQFLFEYIVPEMLNDEVEIIEDTPKEDNKIEKIDEQEATDKIFTYEKGSNLYFLSLYVQHNIVGKINEIIDKINGEE